MRSSKVSINFSRHTDAVLLAHAENILQSMANNPHFSDPIPSLSQLQAAMISYNQALIAAGGFDRRARLKKRERRKQLEIVLRQLSGYVMYMARNDRAILASSGYSLTKTPEPALITNPGAVTLKDGITSGQLISSVRLVKNAKTYFHEITPDPLLPGSVWKHMPSSKSKFTFNGLEAGKRYWVRVGVVGSNGQIAYGAAICSQYVR